MRVSFDLDDTLICCPPTPAEPPLPIWHRWLYPETLRLGAVALMRDLIALDCEIWVYTTSYRHPRSIRGWLRAHGVAVAGIVTQTRHDQVVGRMGPSKYPPAFGIDLHIDDLPGVAMEGERHGFAILTVTPDDLDWARAVLRAVHQLGMGTIASPG